MLLEARDIADPPDVVAAAILVDVFRVQRFTRDFLAERDGFPYRAIAMTAAAHVVGFARTRLLEKLIESANQVRAVNVVSYLFFLVSENCVFRPRSSTLHEVRQKSVELCAGMIRAS